MSTSEKQEVVVTGTPVSRRNQPEPETSTYKLRPGMKHYMDGDLVGEDEEIALTDVEYAAFADKFEPTGKKSSRRRSSGKLDKGVEETETPGDGDDLNAPPPTPQRVSHTPQDIGAKTPDLDAPAANPGNLTRGSHGVKVAGGIPVRAAALQAADEPAKGESEPPRDGPVKHGQQPPIRNSVEATVAGGPGQRAANEAKTSDDSKDKK